MLKLIVYFSNILESVTNTICNTLCYFGISCHHSTLLHCDYLTICDKFVPSYTSFISVLSSRIVFRARFECLEATSGNALEKSYFHEYCSILQKKRKRFQSLRSVLNVLEWTFSFNFVIHKYSLTFKLWDFNWSLPYIYDRVHSRAFSVHIRAR